jgi:RNA polymerase sigma-70 factor, ECF subfamily
MLNILAILLSMPAFSRSHAEFKELYDTYVGLVYFVIRKFNLPQQETEDIVQDVFLKFFQSDTRTAEPEKVKAFLLTIARNKALDVLRKRKRQKTDPVGETLDDEDSQLWRSDKRRILEAEVVAEFLDEIQDEPGAEVLIQYYKEGLTVREIAAKRQEPISSVTSRLTRARARFKEHLRSRLDAMSGEDW